MTENVNSQLSSWVEIGSSFRPLDPACLAGDHGERYHACGGILHAWVLTGNAPRKTDLHRIKFTTCLVLALYPSASASGFCDINEAFITVSCEFVSVVEHLALTKHREAFVAPRTRKQNLVPTLGANPWPSRHSCQSHYS
ncbi:hypothetical protein CEXT_174141 [Caerostris extrusa]|uniref:Uncharacterized protein n=1 Tax=Caerostris extrusa TaxID=172846 RepID=A0AAV4XPV5_CAEEX|nr:hypothetical protein CEXT_174141 [Caerostris extrusa]